MVFSRQTGLIMSGSYQGTEIVKSGPYLHLEGVTLADWALKQVARGARRRKPWWISRAPMAPCK